MEMTRDTFQIDRAVIEVAGGCNYSCSMCRKICVRVGDTETFDAS